MKTNSKLSMTLFLYVSVRQNPQNIKIRRKKNG